MGWSKTAEDNYEILCERLTMKGDDYNYTAWCCSPQAETNTQTKIISNNENSFADMFKGESCFSF